MAQLYNPPFSRLIRSLLLQCVIMLGLVSTGVAQATLPINHDGPWRSYSGTGWTVTGLNADGADLTPSTSGGSAQFRSTAASISIDLENIDAEKETKYRLSYSIKATSTTSGYTANFKVSYLSQDEGEETPSFKTLRESTPSYNQVDRININIPGNAIRVKFELTEIAGTYVLFDALAITQAPTITSFSPTQGAPGQSVTINGLLFNDATRVNIGGIDVSSLTPNADGTSITTTVPEGAVTGKIIVETPAGIATSTNDFVVLGPKFAATAADQFDPKNANIGDEITLRGTYFLGVTQVLFNGVAAVPTQILPGSPVDLIKVNVPLGASKGKITIVSPAGTSVSINSFDVNAPVFIAKDVDGTMREFMPTIGGADTEITIFGKNLSSVTAVKFLGAEGTEDDKNGMVVPFTSDTELIVKAPANAATGPIMLSTADGKMVTSTDFFTFVSAPIITLLNPAFGIAGDEIIIEGENFENTTEVKFGEIVVGIKTEENPTGFEIISATQIKVTVPEGAQTAKIYVTTEMGGTAESDDNFVIVQTPEYVSMNPTEGPIGKTITITGKYFTGVNNITFLGAVEPTPGVDEEAPVADDVIATNFTVVSDTEIRVEVPLNAQTGKIEIANVAGSVSSTEDFTVIIAPVITAFNPKVGAAGTEVTISGYNFTGATAVAFGDVTVNPISVDSENGFTVVSDTVIKVNVPASAVTSKITVTVEDKSDVSEEDFVVIQIPVIADVNAFSPVREVAGAVITITGSNFTGVNSVVFLGEEDGSDDVTATNFTVVSDTEIKVTVPVGAISGKLMVANIAGSATSVESFEVITTPEITDFTAKKGKAGDSVVITGYLLNGATSVTFAGTAGQVEATFTPAADGRSITATVPNGAITGLITVNFPEDFSVATAAEYEVVQAPVIVSFSPVQGMGGDEVTIVGLNFENITEVKFNNAVANIDGLVITDAPGSTVENPLKQFTVLVPTNATTGIISITAAGGTGTTGTDVFTVLKPEQITFTPASSYANEEVTIRGMYLRNLSKVTFNGNNKTAVVIGTVEDEMEDGEPTGFQIVKVKAPFDANIGTITLTTPAGDGTSIEEYSVTEPVIATVTTEDGKTDTGGYAGRTKVTLTGTNFTKYFDEATKAQSDAEPVVTLAGVAMTLESYSDTQISFLLPLSASSGQIVVRSLSGISTGMQFTVEAPTNIVINPNPAYTNQLITVTADNLIGVKSITYNGDVIATETLVEDETAGTFTFIAPVAKNSPTNGQASLIIETNSGIGVANFTILKPIISSIVKTRDYTAQNPVRTVTINGANFIKYWDGVAVSDQNPVVTFTGAANPAVIKTAADNSLVVEIPADATTGPITVTSVNGSAQSTTFTVIGQPVISGFTPTAEIEGAIITINGSFFDEAVKVTFLGDAGDMSDDVEVLATAFEPGATNTQIKVKVPVGANNGKIAVTNLNTANPTGVSANDFRVVKMPIVTDVTADSRMYGATVTLTGENLADVNTIDNGKVQVYFTGHGGTWIKATVDTYDLFDATRITFKIPAKSITGPLKVVNKAGEVLTEEFVVTSPLIVAFDHLDNTAITTSSPARINERILIKGYKLGNIGTVSFVGAMATSYAEISENELEVTVPRGATTGKVTIRSEVEGSMINTVSEMNVNIIQPLITVTPNSLVFMEKPGVQSAAKSYTITAQGLMVGETTVSVSMRAKGANGNADLMLFEMSETGAEGTFAPMFTTDINVNEDGTIEPTTLWVRFKTDISSYHYAEVFHRAPLGATTAALALEGNSVTPLPVELIAFNATKQSNGVTLTWATASEQDNDYFEVQMAEDMKSEFIAVGKVKSKVGTTSIRQDYQFNHKGNFAGTRYYRLKQVDLDGTSVYSKVVAVSANEVSLAVGPKVYPNPIKPESKLVYNAAEAGKLNVRVVNMNGTTIQSSSYDIEAGENTITLNLSNNLPSGIYILITEFNGKTEQVKLLKQ